MIKTTRIKLRGKAFDKGPLYTYRQVQKLMAPADGISALGTKYKKGERVVFIYATGENPLSNMVVFTVDDLQDLVKAKAADKPSPFHKFKNYVKAYWKKRRDVHEAKLVEKAGGQHKDNLKDFVTEFGKDFKKQIEQKSGP
jgi:hypothetical protein